MAIDKEFYNEASASKLGWEPSWFLKDHGLFDKKLTKAIKEFQSIRGLTADGLCGPGTFRYINSELESQRDLVNSRWISDSSDVIWWQDKAIKIDWPSDKVHTFKDIGFPYSVSTGVTKNTRKRTIKSFVNHWDVCLSSTSCASVLAKRGISVHFCIDNDGTIIQLHDLNDSCWHAGNRNVNKYSIGVEIANAYYPKYQDWYVRNGFGKRPMMEGALAQNKELDPFTWFYPVQLQALDALWKAIHEGCDVPLEAPETKWAVDAECVSGKFKGFMNHFHCSRKKIDVAGLDIEKRLLNIK
jgi:hypothetical protein